MLGRGRVTAERALGQGQAGVDLVGAFDAEALRLELRDEEADQGVVALARRRNRAWKRAKPPQVRFERGEVRALDLAAKQTASQPARRSRSKVRPSSAMPTSAPSNAFSPSPAKPLSRATNKGRPEAAQAWARAIGRSPPPAIRPSFTPSSLGRRQA